MFEHSVKVPRHYKVAANILKKVSTEGGSVKTLLYDNKLRHFKTNVLFALITECIKHAPNIDKIFESCNLQKNEPRLDPWLAKILVTELLFGKKALPGKSKPEQTLLSYKDQFDKYTSEHQDDLKTKETVRRPRYVRINTNLMSTSDAIRAFQDEGCRFIRCTSGSYDDYLKQIQGLTEDDFTQDYHVKTVFVFSAGTKLHEHELYLENKIILQDKATALAVHLLAPPAGSVALDMCAAPGMKTTQLAAYMRNQGKIYAVERNEQRYQTLKEFVEKTGSTCVETLHKDALELKRGDYDDVEYILLDPSCSGSGMDFCVHNYIEDTRLAKLTSLQEKFLKHAMNSFPKAKRIVYSTCSLYPEENERVVTNIVKASRAKWRVLDVKKLLKGQWNNFGSGMYGSMGNRCLYAKPDLDFTTGFFLAVLDRDFKEADDNEKVNEKPVKVSKNDDVKPNGDLNNSESKKKRKNVHEVTENPKISNEEEVSESSKKKKKKKDKTREVDNVVEEINVSDPATDDYETNMTKKKKKKDKHKTSESNNAANEAVETPVVLDEQKPKKKKKRNAEIVEIQIPEEENEQSYEPVKKKKKNKHKEPKDNDFVETQDADKEIIESPKKKKKKKNIDVEN